MTLAERQAKTLTAVWNTPIAPKNCKQPMPALFAGVPFFDSPDIFTPGHTPDCSCEDCFTAFMTAST